MKRLTPLGLLLVSAALAPSSLRVAEQAGYQNEFHAQSPRPRSTGRMLAASQDCDFALRRDFTQAQVVELLSRSQDGRKLVERLEAAQREFAPLHVVERSELSATIQEEKKKVYGVYFPETEVRGTPLKNVVSFRSGLPLFVYASLFAHEVQHYLDRFDPAIQAILARCGSGGTEQEKRYCVFEHVWSEFNAFGEQKRILDQLVDTLDCSKEKLMKGIYKIGLSPYDPANSIYQTQHFLAVYRVSREELKKTLQEISLDREIGDALRTTEEHRRRFQQLRIAVE